MNQKPNDKFEASILRVESILKRTRADLMELAPEIDSLKAAVTGKSGASGASKTEDGPQAGWFHFLSHNS